jgi:dTDP-4-amino-4,6-dideoxygalactose transaminase
LIPKAWFGIMLQQQSGLSMNQHSRIASAPSPFIDLTTQRQRLGTRIDAAVSRVLEHCQFVMGPEVHALEAELAQFAGVRHALSCASGTDALLLVLMAREIGPGDAVICPSFTFCATAEVAALLGATPVFADVDPETFNIAPESLQKAIDTARAQGLSPKAVIPVDLFGLPADHDAIAAIAKAENLFVLDDAAQAFGATYKGRRLGPFGHAMASSFFPAKPLGCYGDGGAVLTDDSELAERVKSIRLHGQGSDRYDNVRIGITGRMDTIQAAVLLEKLKIFPDEIEARDRVAERYRAGLSDLCRTPVVPSGYSSVWAQYTLRLAPGRREALAAFLKAEGVPTGIYYPIPLHRQTAYRHYPTAQGGLPVSEGLAAEVLSLPMHPYLTPELQDRVIEAVRRGLA